MACAVIFDMYETLITLFACPVYFSQHMAEDMGIDVNDFRELWKTTETARSIGEATLEQVLESIMREKQCFSEERLHLIVQKRISVKRESFQHIHPGIIPMLAELKNRNIKIGLISNCYSEEAKLIRESILFPYFDAAYMSYEQGVQKPDEEIFHRCINALGVAPEECLYIGDGGSYELETAEKIGMKALQAAWYLKDEPMQPAKRMEHFRQLDTPSEIFDYIVMI